MSTRFTSTLLEEIRNNRWQDRELNLSGQYLSLSEIRTLCAALETNTYIKALDLISLFD